MNNGLIAAGRLALLALGMAVAGSGLGGCASAEMDKLQDLNRSLTNRNQEMQQELASSKNENGILQKQRAANEAAINDLRRSNGDLVSKLQGAQSELERLGGALGGLNIGPLDEATDRALTEFAARYPDMVEYDRAKGMLRFKSDLTFDSGSATVKDNAKGSLKALADVLRTSSAMAYEVHVIGHTDAQKISANTAKLHPTNMHLSAHRAIAVRDVLVSDGVPADHVQAAGWGEFRPVVANGPKGEATANRRVEIYLTRSTASTGSEAPPPATGMSPDRARPPERQIEPTK
jgi:chemotaxis protein MotB